MKNKILIVGGGGHAQSCIDIIENEKKYQIFGIIDKKSDTVKNKFKMFNGDRNINELRNKVNNAFIGIGQIKSPDLRIKIFKKLKKNQYNLPIIISKFAAVSKKTTIKPGTIIMNFANISRNTKIGLCSIINTKANLEHEVIVGNFCHVSTGAILNGNVEIGDNTFIGSGAIINQNIKIGNNCIIGSGKIISKNIKSKTVIK